MNIVLLNIFNFYFVQRHEMVKIQNDRSWYFEINLVDAFDQNHVKHRNILWSGDISTGIPTAYFHK